MSDDHFFTSLVQLRSLTEAHMVSGGNPNKRMIGQAETNQIIEEYLRSKRSPDSNSVVSTGIKADALLLGPFGLTGQVRPLATGAMLVRLPESQQKRLERLSREDQRKARDPANYRRVNGIEYAYALLRGRKEVVDGD